MGSNSARVMRDSAERAEENERIIDSRLVDFPYNRQSRAEPTAVALALLHGSAPCLINKLIGQLYGQL